MRLLGSSGKARDKRLVEMANQEVTLGHSGLKLLDEDEQGVSLIEGSDSGRLDRFMCTTLALSHL